MISAIDEKLTPSTNIDLFRIKICTKDNRGMVVRDNTLGDKYANPTTAEADGYLNTEGRLRFETGNLSQQDIFDTGYLVTNESWFGSHFAGLIRIQYRNFFSCMQRL